MSLLYAYALHTFYLQNSNCPLPSYTWYVSRNLLENQKPWGTGSSAETLILSLIFLRKQAVFLRHGVQIKPLCLKIVAYLLN